MQKHKELDYIKWSILEDLYEGSEKSLKQKTEKLSKGLVTFKSPMQIAEYIQTFKKSPIENIKDLEDEFGFSIVETTYGKHYLQRFKRP